LLSHRPLSDLSQRPLNQLDSCLIGNGTQVQTLGAVNVNQYLFEIWVKASLFVPSWVNQNCVVACLHLTRGQGHGCLELPPFTPSSLHEFALVINDHHTVLARLILLFIWHVLSVAAKPVALLRQIY